MQLRQFDTTVGGVDRAMNEGVAGELDLLQTPSTGGGPGD